ncbi:MAG: restriction endonuclease subunit S [Hormoscilla sp. GM7CHS1pb]|nr:restriction endonuclease subunit S [Hormoscilla sp. GM7CHS1pb]
MIMSKHKLALDNSQVPEGYKKTEVGVIPEDWEVKKLLDVVDYVDYRGKTPPKQESGIFLVTAKNIREGFIDYESSQEYVSEVEYDKIMRRGKPKIGDVIITTEAPLGNVATVDNESIALAQRVIKYRARDQKLNHEYLKYYLLSNKFQKILLDNSSGTTAQGIKGSILHTLPIIIATPTEQRAIAQTLSDVDGLIAALDRAIAKKRNIKTATMQELLTGKKRLPGFNEEWQVKRLGDIANITMGQSPSSQYYNSKEIGLPLIQGNADIKNRRAVIRNYTSEVTKKCYYGDIILSVRAPVGEVAKTNFDACIGRGVSAISYPNDFLYHYLIFRESRWSKLSKGSTFDSINSTEIKSLEIKLPVDLKEQSAIASILSDIDAEIAALEKRRAKTKAMKQGIMQELLTGKTRLIVDNNP